MRRDLKFRAYDKFTKKYIAEGYHFFGEIMEFGYIDGYLSKYPNPEYGGATLLRANDVVVEQWTNLQDSNIKDIYEGDIIEAEFVGHGNCLNRTTGTVVYSQKHLAYILTDITYQWGNPPADNIVILSWYSEQRLKVIGNIHNNATLGE